LFLITAGLALGADLRVRAKAKRDDN